MNLSSYQLGIAAYIYGITENPYHYYEEMKEYLAWRDGWNYAKVNNMTVRTHL